MIEVEVPGLLTLVQDLGRPGWASLGVSPSGAFDRAAHRLAQRLVGNREGAAGLESLGGGLALRARTACVIAVTGADGPITVSGHGESRQVSRHSPLHLRPDDVLTLGTPTWGLRSYVAVRHGLRVATVLGSAARDTLAGLGPPPLNAGDVLDLADDERGHPHVDHAPARHVQGVIGVLPGPRKDWFDDAALSMLLSAAWTVSPTSDRVGVRLEGPALRRRDPATELPSEPMVTGALQVPPDGHPVLLGPDHPTTGGYPVIAVVMDSDLDRWAQVRPGDEVRFGTLHTS